MNGVFTKDDGAKKNKEALELRLDREYKGEKVKVDYLLNPSHLGGAGDLLMAAYQKYFDDETVQDYDLIEMLKTASEKVATQKLLLVAHSQGNFYANSFYDTVSGKVGGVPAQSIGVYAVATPSGRVAGGGQWLTSDTDKIIAGVVGRVPFRKIMSPNTRIELQSGDNPLGHDFSDIYLKYRGDKIVSDIESSLARLQTNGAQDAGKPCLAPPKLSVVHKVEGAVLAVADPVASASRDTVVGAAVFAEKTAAQTTGAVSALGNFIGRTTFAATVWTYQTGLAAAKTTAGFISDSATATYLSVKSASQGLGNLVVGGNNSPASVAIATAPVPVREEANQAAKVPAPVYGPVLVAGAPVETAAPVIARTADKKSPPAPPSPSQTFPETATVAVAEDTAQKVEDTAQKSGRDLAATHPSPSSEKTESETRYSPKIIFIGLPSPGFGGGEPSSAPARPPAPKPLASSGEPSILSQAPRAAPLAIPLVAAPQCDYSLAADGCLLATTTVRFSWTPIGGADYYEVNKNGLAATTTETALEVSAPDFSDYTLAVSAVSVATTSAVSHKTVSVATIPVAINEIAWMGTAASASDEWMELKNNTGRAIDLSQWALRAKDDTPYIALTGVMAPHEYRVLERRKNTVIAAAPTESYGNGAARWALGNSGEEMILSYASTTLDATPQISGNTWTAGYNSTTTRKTMERYASKESGADENNWSTNLGFIKNGADTASNVIDGTPGARNSVSYLINKGRDITQNLTLTADDGYFISTSTAVSASSTLSVEPGVVIKFSEPDPWSPPALEVLGGLKVRGTAEEPVVFEAFSGDRVGKILLDGGAATSTIEHVLIENTRGIKLNGGAKLEINDTNFVKNYYGLDVEDGSTVLAKNISFASTTREAISEYNGGVMAIASSTIKDNLDGDAVGIYGGSHLSVASTTINRVLRGDGIGVYNSTAVITNSEVSNVLRGDGIGVYNSSDVNVSSTTIDNVHGEGAFVADSKFSISSSTVKNTGSDGINLFTTNSTVENVIFENGGGDGIVIGRGSVTIEDSTVSGFAKGVGIIVRNPASPVKIANTEVSENKRGILTNATTSVSMAPDVSVHDNGQNIIVSSP